MQYSLYINQLFIANHPQCDELDIIDVAIFDCVRKLIAGNWGQKKLEGETLWANIRVSKIIQEMPLLRNGKGAMFKSRAIHGRISKLCDAGLLQKREQNQRTVSSFIALGDLANEYDSYTQPLHLNAITIASTCNPPLHLDANYKNTIQNTLSNSSDTDSPREPEVKEKVVRKAKPTRAEVTRFYENEKRNSLEAKLSPELIAAAAPWKIPNEQLVEKLVAGYAEIVDYMMIPSDMWPAGMWRCVLTKPNQLNFLQFCKLILEYGMTRAELKEYLNSWENKRYDNDNLYATLYSWKNKENNSPKAAGSYNNGMNGDFPKKGLSNPTQVHQ